MKDSLDTGDSMVPSRSGWKKGLIWTFAITTATIFIVASCAGFGFGGYFFYKNLIKPDQLGSNLGLEVNDVTTKINKPFTVSVVITNNNNEEVSIDQIDILAASVGKGVIDIMGSDPAPRKQQFGYDDNSNPDSVIMYFKNLAVPAKGEKEVVLRGKSSKRGSYKVEVDAYPVGATEEGGSNLFMITVK
jgi:hypothetical protein